tara:strand:+ start:4857 stop:5330 length:474 start_codon:yes stop_codon:yes gene_type:complete
MDPPIPPGGAITGGSADVAFLDSFTLSRTLLPSIEFEVDLTMPTSELIGPKLNLRKVPVYHSEGNSADTTRLMVEQRESQFSAILQGFTAAGGRAVKHGDRFTVEGQKAIYLRDMYTTDNPTGFPASQLALLKVVGSDLHDHDVYKRGILTPGVKIQ